MTRTTTAEVSQERGRERETARFGRGVEAFVLLILAQGPSYGYEIRRRLEEYGFERPASDPAALYRLLRDFEAAGSITSEWDIAGTGPARRYYSLTAQGRGDLERAAERVARVKRRSERFLAMYDALKREEAAPGGRVEPVAGAAPLT